MTKSPHPLHEPWRIQNRHRHTLPVHKQRHKKWYVICFLAFSALLEPVPRHTYFSGQKHLWECCVFASLRLCIYHRYRHGTRQCHLPVWSDRERLNNSVKTWHSTVCFSQLNKWKRYSVKERSNSLVFKRLSLANQKSYATLELICLYV